MLIKPSAKPIKLHTHTEAHLSLDNFVRVLRYLRLAKVAFIICCGLCELNCV